MFKTDNILTAFCLGILITILLTIGVESCQNNKTEVALAACQAQYGTCLRTELSQQFVVKEGNDIKVVEFSQFTYKEIKGK